MKKIEGGGNIIDLRTRQKIKTGGIEPQTLPEKKRYAQRKILISAIAALLLSGVTIADILEDQSITEEVNRKSPRPTLTERHYAGVIFDFRQTNPEEIQKPSPATATAVTIAKREYEFQKAKKAKRDDFDGTRPWLDAAGLLMSLALIGYSALAYIKYPEAES